MLHRYKTFNQVVSNVRENLDLQGITYYAFSFKDSYNERIRRSLEKNIPNLEVQFVKKKVPEFIKEKDLFYNKTNLEYVRKTFPKSRKNYLHMCEFLSDISATPHINKYDIVVRFDDDSWFKKKFDFDFDFFKSDKTKLLATAYTQIDDSSKRKETKIGFFEAAHEYCKIKNLKPKYWLLNKSFEKKEIKFFHQIPWPCGNFNIYDMSIYQNKEWKDWIDFIKSKGGIYTNRWADLEIIGTFLYIYFEDPILNLDLYPDIYFDRHFNQEIIQFKRNIVIRAFSKLKKKLKILLKKIKKII